MTIIFSNGKSLPYKSAITLERDFKNGYTRPSVEVTVPLAETSYEEISQLAGMDFTLIGEAMYEDETPPMSEWTGYTIKGKIVVEDDSISFKVYKLSDVEMRIGDYESALDELLIMLAEEE